MFTFIELQGFSNAASYCYLMMSSGLFRNYSFKIPLPVTLSQAQAVLEKFAEPFWNGETGWHSDNLLQRNTQWPNLSGVDLS